MRSFFFHLHWFVCPSKTRWQVTGGRSFGGVVIDRSIRIRGPFASLTIDSSDDSLQKLERTSFKLINYKEQKIDHPWWRCLFSEHLISNLSTNHLAVNNWSVSWFQTTFWFLWFSDSKLNVFVVVYETSRAQLTLDFCGQWYLGVEF